MSKIECFETDYVYDKGNGEYSNIHIKLNVGKESFILELTSDELPDKEAVRDILNQLESNAFKKLRISIIKDCKVLVCVGDKKYNVETKDTGIVVTKMTLLEE